MSEYINRAYALEVIRHISEDEPWQEACVNNVIRLLNELPSIDIKTGKWQITSAYPHIVYCSECHKRYAQTNWAAWNDKDYPLPKNYCPFCGAKMEGIDD